MTSRIIISTENGRQGAAALRRVVRSVRLLAVLLSVVGCGTSAPEREEVQFPGLTPSVARAERRAFDGAPPVIPHARLGMSCTACHTETGSAAPPIGFAPANPHFGADYGGAMANCVQCHVFQSTEAEFRLGNSFVGLPQSLEPADRLFEGAPPVTPHTLLLRENCQACHTAASARPEIRCSHPERSNCRQCHVTQEPANTKVFEREL